mmetsp:Transcript_108833/g.339156  ORF Transcript_108833/g.339156 Transcript_108833/m.339156 type:complete len:297 (+) Transcript_108833:79-969(+)
MGWLPGGPVAARVHGGGGGALGSAVPLRGRGAPPGAAAAVASPGPGGREALPPGPAQARGRSAGGPRGAAERRQTQLLRGVGEPTTWLRRFRERGVPRGGRPGDAGGARPVPRGRRLAARRRQVAQVLRRRLLAAGRVGAPARAELRPRAQPRALLLAERHAGPPDGDAGALRAVGGARAEGERLQRPADPRVPGGEFREDLGLAPRLPAGAVPAAEGGHARRCEDEGDVPHQLQDGAQRDGVRLPEPVQAFQRPEHSGRVCPRDCPFEQIHAAGQERTSPDGVSGRGHRHGVVPG